MDRSTEEHSNIEVGKPKINRIKVMTSTNIATQSSGRNNASSFIGIVVLSAQLVQRG